MNQSSYRSLFVVGVIIVISYFFGHLVIAARKIVTKKSVVAAVKKVENSPTLNQGKQYEHKKIRTSSGEFVVDMITIDLSQPGVKIITDTASNGDCVTNCPAKSLKEFAQAHKAFAAIHGAYFCPPDYSFCKSKINSTFFTFLNSATGVVQNAGEVKWLKGSIYVFDTNNKPYFFPSAPDFKSLQKFESQYGVNVAALFSNAPALVDHGQNIVETTRPLEDKERRVKSLRGGIGVKGSMVYLVIAQKATVPDLAQIYTTLGVDSALNLDGGGSSAMFWNGKYVVGPGRSLPTAILFKQE